MRLDDTACRHDAATVLSVITVIGNSKLPSGELVDLKVLDGVVVEHLTPGKSKVDIDLGGQLVVPAFCDPHAHLDKALTADIISNERGDLEGAIRAWQSHYGDRTEEEIYQRSRKVLRMALVNGTLSIRTHVDVGANAGLVAVDALCRLREELSGLIDLQIVALVATPISGQEGKENRKSLQKAIERGVDVVGGCPHLDSDPEKAIAVAMDAALEAQLPLDLHMDETLDPAMLSVVVLGRSVLEKGFDQAVTASHCVSLSVLEPKRQRSIASLLKEASVNVVSLPQTNLFLQARDRPTAPPRGITPISLLRDEGVVVGAGGDNVQDPFNTMGRADALETAALTVAASHQSVESGLDLVTDSSRNVMGLPLCGYRIGSKASLVAAPVSTVRELIATAPTDRVVIRDGEVVARTTSVTEMIRDF